MKSRASILIALGLTLALPLTAAAAPPWSPVEKVPQIGALSGGQGTAVPAADLDAAGNGAAVWVERRGPLNSVVVGAHRTAAGTWSRKVLSKPGIVRTRPVVAMSNADHTVFAWDRTVRRGGKVRGAAIEYAVYRGGSFGPARRASTHRRRAGKPSLVMGGRGAGTLVWLELRSGRREIFGARFDAKKNRFVRRSRISRPGRNAPDPRVDLTTAGGTIVSWKSSGDVHVAVAPRAGAAFRAPVTLNPRRTTAPGPYDVAIGPRGTALAAWESRAANGKQRRIQVADINRRGAVGARELLSIEKVKGLAGPVAAVDASGRAVVGWQSGVLLPGKDKAGLRVSERPRGKTWRASHRLANNSSPPAAAGRGSAGATIITTGRSFRGGTQVFTGSGRRWARPLTIAGRLNLADEYNATGLVGGGRGVLRRDDGGTDLFWFAETRYDAPEKLRALFTASVTADGVGGEPIQIARVKGEGSVAMSGLAGAVGPRGHQMAVWRQRGQLRAAVAPPS